MDTPPATSPRAGRWLLAVASGALLVTAFPGSGDQSWFAFVALVPLLVAVDGASRRHAALLGFVSGAVFWTVTVAWPAPWVMRYASVPVPKALATGVLLVSVLAAFTAAFCALLPAARRQAGAAWVVVVASLWVALELVRTDFAPAFPWNVLGASQYRREMLIQVASVTGVYGVSFVVVAVNAALAWLVCGRRERWDATGALGVGAAAVVLAVSAAWLAPARAGGPQVPIAVVQGNIDQNVKWDPAYVDAALAAHRTLTLEAARAGARLVVWPETAVPLRDRQDPRWREVEQLAQDAGVHLLVGAPHGTTAAPHNSAFLIGPAGELGRYDKRHLLPFGEYVPWEQALGFFRVVNGTASEFSRGGAEATVFSTPLGRLATVICYEGIFPTEVRDFFVAGADILVNITNDAYFGPSPTPVQHLALTVFRAVEHRAWLVRAANTGISAIVAPDGRIVRASPLFARGVLAGTVTARRETTFYTRYGDVFAWGALGVVIAALVPLPWSTSWGAATAPPTPRRSHTSRGTRDVAR